MKISISHQEYFSASHRLHNPTWSDEKNKNIFDLCNNQNYHGHNYRLVVSLSGEFDPVTGRIYSAYQLGALVRQHIINPFNHKNLNLDIDHFKKLNPTTENLVIIIWNILKPYFGEQYDLKILLYETEKNFAEYPTA